MKKRDLLRRKLPPVVRDCPFCKKESILNYKEVEVLKKYITERGKIIGKDRTGICSKHQRGLAREIKRARFLALLPFTSFVR